MEQHGVIISWLLNYKSSIDEISNVFTAIGTVGAVIVALWLGYRDSKPKLKVYAYVGTLTPEMTEHLWLSCINVSKQPIVCTGLVFKPNIFRKIRIMPNPTFELKNLSAVKPPRLLQFSERLDQHFDDRFFTTFEDFLSKKKWWAKIQLKLLWRIVATTNIKEFDGKLGNSLIKKILNSQFSN
jgi:hypothetical protein